ncbi:MAG: hypothetical protein V4608_15420 [Bacteroidota bacterium]
MVKTAKINKIKILIFLIIMFTKTVITLGCNENSCYRQKNNMKVMDTVNVYFEIINKTILVLTLNKEESDQLLLAHKVKILEKEIKHYNINIYSLNDETILCEIKKGLIHSIIVKNIDDFFLIQTRASLYKLEKNIPTFYSVRYFDKFDIPVILEEKEGRILREYSDDHEKLFLLNDGKYFHIEYIKTGNYEESNGYLYNSLNEIQRLYLLERIVERKKK